MIKYNPYVLMTDGSMARNLSALNLEGERQRFDSHYVETIFLKIEDIRRICRLHGGHTIFSLLDVSPS